ncbi:hypothetical protein KVR01_004238 [Diaporthe batatas]|uniref:uncharacterized protein n=1 Tax=Diaporthe batatas TaxID=748121 RepID=UPI001D0537E8|nr:uncharacterized protein KVR01_004238 [Diaporthe batatas]KAG8165686.1 hypothetical protein KVR01_004238 [Diaporthe batatas]
MPCMGILHPDTTYAEIDKRELHPIVAAAVCAMTSRIIAPGHEHVPFAEQCADRVDFYLFSNINSLLRKPAHKNLVVLVCAICHFWHENQTGKVWMYMSLAARLITALQLNRDGAGGSLVEQEMNRRLVWACYILDRLLADGSDEHLVLRDDNMHLGLPVSDEVLYQAVRDEASKAVMSLVNRLQSQLVVFRTTLPEEFLLTDANINRFLNSPWGPSFIMLHTLSHVLHIDLYRFTVPGIREAASPDLLEELPNDFVYKSQRQAVGYAVSLARFLRVLQLIVARRPPGTSTEELLTVDEMFAIYVVQPTKILLAARRHRLFNDLESSTAPLARPEAVDDAALAALVQSNMQLISRFARFFPRVLEIVSLGPPLFFTPKLWSLANHAAQTQELQHEVDNFSHNPHNNHVGPVGTSPAAGPSGPLRLPAPHDLLERVFRPEEADRYEQRNNRSAADRWLQSKKIEKKRSSALMTPPMSIATDPAASISLPASGAPEIPGWLAEARGCDPVSKSPSQGSGGTSPADAQACFTNPYGAGLGLTGAHPDGDARSMPRRRQTNFDRAYHMTPLMVHEERAMGSESAAAIPNYNEPSNNQAPYNGRNHNGPRNNQAAHRGRNPSGPRSTHKSRLNGPPSYFE